MKKIIIAIAAVLATAFGASAVDYAYTLVVNKTDGTKVNYLFANTPVATIEGDNLTIVDLTNTTGVVYPISDITNMTFDREEILNGVEGVLGSNGDVAFGVTATALEAYGLPAATEIFIFDASGVLRVSGRSADDGTASLEIGTLEKGVYLVRAGKHIFKFIR